MLLRFPESLLDFFPNLFIPLIIPHPAKSTKQHKIVTNSPKIHPPPRQKSTLQATKAHQPQYPSTKEKWPLPEKRPLQNHARLSKSAPPDARERNQSPLSDTTQARSGITIAPHFYTAASAAPPPALVPARTASPVSRPSVHAAHVPPALLPVTAATFRL